MKLADVEESRLEAAREPRLDVRDPGLLPEDRDCMLLERLRAGRERRVRTGRAAEPSGTSRLTEKTITGAEGTSSRCALLTVPRADHAPTFSREETGTPRKPPNQKVAELGFQSRPTAFRVHFPLLSPSVSQTSTGCIPFSRYVS